MNARSERGLQRTALCGEPTSRYLGVHERVGGGMLMRRRR